MDRPPAPMTNVPPPISVATASLRYFDRQRKEAKSAEGNDLSCPFVSGFFFLLFIDDRKFEIEGKDHVIFLEDVQNILAAHPPGRPPQNI
jgi:hypothetical protein